MATLILGAVGTALGGPLGGAIGALAGRAFDQAVLLKPKGREGPRLQDLQVQTSTYGSQIPKIFGAMRVAGTVIWATDLRETKSKSGGGKGQPSVTNYSYAASFAVALSARRVKSVGRIWADGNLLRGAAGDFKTELGAFRLHLGSADQAVDPLIAAAQGIGVTPAHRGIAYAVFEDLALADYGNRIPSLTFEIFADDGAVAVGAIAAEVTEDVVSGAGGLVAGYAASGADVASALTPLVEAQGLVVRDGPFPGGFVLDAPEVRGAVVTRAMLAARINDAAQVAVKSGRDPAEDVPVRLAVRHYAPERDYQAGIQTAVRPGAGRRLNTVDVPATMTADEAKGVAQARLAEAWRARDRMEIVCGWEALVHRAGSVVTVEGIAGLWRVVDVEWEAMGVRMTLRGWRSGSQGVAQGTAGAVVRQPDQPHGPTVLRIADLPVLGDAAPVAPVVVVAAAGASAGWRKAALFTVAADGAATPMGGTAPAAVMGTVIVPPGAGSAAMFDDRVWLDVALLAADDGLSGADDAALLRGANMCLVGDEVLQFGAVQAIGPGQYRLRHLLRGRRGTEWAMSGHVASEGFVLLEADRLVSVPQDVAAAGALVQVIAVGIGDAVPAAVERVVTGEALTPLSPVHVRVDSDGAGELRIGWTRRSRAGWGWADGVDAPLGEESERYRVEILRGADVVRVVEVGGPGWTYDAAMRAADAAAGGALRVAIRQMGTHAVGRAAVVEI